MSWHQVVQSVEDVGEPEIREPSRPRSIQTALSGGAFDDVDDTARVLHSPAVLTGEALPWLAVLLLRRRPFLHCHDAEG